MEPETWNAICPRCGGIPPLGGGTMGMRDGKPFSEFWQNPPCSFCNGKGSIEVQPVPVQPSEEPIGDTAHEPGYGRFGKDSDDPYERRMES